MAIKMQAWIDDVGHRGLEVRKIPGYHDEPLKGERLGQRSIRLNRAYRAIYVVDSDGVIQFLEILEVTNYNY